MYHHARESTVLEWDEPRRVREVVEEWTPYRGKRGGEGWQWNGQGQPIYQKEKPTRRRGEWPAESGQAHDAEPNRTVPDTIRTSDTPESLEKSGSGGESGLGRTNLDTPRGTEAIQRHVESWTPEQKMADWKAKGVRGASFKSFFGDWEHEPETASKVVDADTGEPKETAEISGQGSKVTDQDGKPVAVYHGTASGGFTAFDKRYINDDNLYGPGFYFTEDKQVADEYQSKEGLRGVILGEPSVVAEEARRRLRQMLVDAHGRVADVYLKNAPEWRKVDDLANYYGDELLLDTLKFDAASGGLKWFAKEGADLSDLVGTTGETKAVYLNIRRPFDIDNDELSLDSITAAPESVQAAVRSFREAELQARQTDLEAAEQAVERHRDNITRFRQTLLDKGYDPEAADPADMAWAPTLRQDRATTAALIRQRFTEAGRAGEIRDASDEDLVREVESTGRLAFPGIDTRDLYSSKIDPVVASLYLDWSSEQAILDDAQATADKAAQRLRSPIAATVKHLEQRQLVAKEINAMIRAAGYDGLTHIGGDRMGDGHHHRVWIAFEPEQIKAVENRGTFDPTPNLYETHGRVRERVAFEAWDESKYRRDEGGRFARKDEAVAAVGGQDIGPDEEVEVVVDGWVSWTGPKREADQMVRDQWDETQDLRGISIHRSGQGPRAPERVAPPKPTHTPAGIPIPEYSHDRDHAPGGAKWRDPPEVMYHATFSAPEIEREGFRPLDRLDPRHRVLGGSDTTSMSLTTRENAELYRDGLATARQLAQGQVPWDRRNAQLLAHHFGVQDAEFDRLWREQDRRTGVPDDQRWYDLMQGVSFAGRKFPLFITGGWTDALKNASGPPRLVKVARGSAEQFSYNPGETEWKVRDPEKLRVVGVESAVVAATATPRRIAESFDETKVKRDREGQFAKQEGRSPKPDEDPTDFIADVLGAKVVRKAGKVPTLQVGDNELALMVERVGSDELRLPGIEATGKGKGLGTKAMQALRRYADATGRKLRIEMVANTLFFNKFPWLQHAENGEYQYDPTGPQRSIGNEVRPSNVDPEELIGKIVHFEGKPFRVSSLVKGGTEPDRWKAEAVNGKGYIVVGGKKVRAENASAIADKAPISDSGPKSSGDSKKPRRTDTPEFKRWFGKSKAVGKDGEPLVVYHGTRSLKDFDEFKTARRKDASRLGAYFSESPAGADIFARGELGRVYPVYLAVEKPLDLRGKSRQEIAAILDFLPSHVRHDMQVVSDAGPYSLLEKLDRHQDLVPKLKKRGYDGIVFDDQTEGTTWVAFRPEQIKSAAANRGTYDPKSPKITESSSLELSPDGKIRQITTLPVARESQAMSLREAATGLARALVQQTAPPEPDRYRDAVVAVARRVSEFCNVPAAVLLQRHVDPAVFGSWKPRPHKAQESVSWQRAPDVLEDWTRYEGERGGKGWQWNGQGEPRYQEEKPSEPGGESSNIQPGPANRQEAGPSGVTPPVAKPEGGKMTLSQQMLDQAKEQHGQWPDQGWDKVADTLAGLPDAERAKVDAYLAGGDFKNRSKKLSNRIKSGKTPIVPMNEDEQAAAQQAQRDAEAIQRAEAAKKEQERIEAARKREEQRKADLATTPLAQKESGAAGWVVDKRGTRLYVTGTRYGDPTVDRLRQLGAHWDKDAKAWWIGVGKKADLERLVADVNQHKTAGQAEAVRRKDEGLAVKIPYEDTATREQAKQLGARWDAVNKQWLLPNADAKAKIDRLLADAATKRQEAASRARAEADKRESDARKAKIPAGGRMFSKTTDLRGQGYGVGNAIKDRDGKLWIVTDVERPQRFEDGLSMGMGRDDGYEHTAYARPATPEEAKKISFADRRAVLDKELRILSVGPDDERDREAHNQRIAAALKAKKELDEEEFGGLPPLSGERAERAEEVRRSVQKAAMQQIESAKSEWSKEEAKWSQRALEMLASKDADWWLERSNHRPQTIIADMTDRYRHGQKIVLSEEEAESLLTGQQRYSLMDHYAFGWDEDGNFVMWDNDQTKDEIPKAVRAKAGLA